MKKEKGERNGAELSIILAISVPYTIACKNRETKAFLLSVQNTPRYLHFKVPKKKPAISLHKQKEEEEEREEKGGEEFAKKE